MLRLDVSKLSDPKYKIHHTLINAAKNEKNIRIKRAAEICGCSVSKISKFAKKLGFSSYKEYIGFVYGEAPQKEKNSGELIRIRDFVDNFDVGIVDEFIELLDKHEKIILFGYGPSLICAEYFEYKLRFATRKAVMTAADEDTVRTLLDDQSLLLVFSATGKFKSFSEIFAFTKEKNVNALLIAEEYNTTLLDDCDNIIYLTKSTRGEELNPYEKSRTIFFIFIEEVILRLLASGKEE